jgi:hypothetical protein
VGTCHTTDYVLRVDVAPTPAGGRGATCARNNHQANGDRPQRQVPGIRLIRKVEAVNGKNK